MSKINKITLSGTSYDIEDSDAQEALTTKADKSHTHSKSDITDLTLDWSSITDKPTKLSDFENDCNFITKISVVETLKVALSQTGGGMIPT